MSRKSSDVHLLPDWLRDDYEIITLNNPVATLQHVYPDEYKDLLDMLDNFELLATDIIKPGGSKSPIAGKLDSFLYARGWKEEQFHVHVDVNGYVDDLPTHKVDCYKNRVAIEVEWNNKDPFFDRDLNNFRLLYEHNAIDVGIIITRATSLQNIFGKLGKGSSYGSSTTHMGKLIPKLLGKGGGGCPIIAIGITEDVYRDNRNH